MSGLTRLRPLAIALLAGLGMSVALPGAVGAGAAVPPAMPHTSSAASTFIILLKDTQAGVPGRSASRAHAVRTLETPFVTALETAGAKVHASGVSLPYLVASLTSAQHAALATNPAVALVVPDSTIKLPRPGPRAEPPGPSSTKTAGRAGAITAPTSICGTASSPELDPEALSVINDVNPSYNGAGVTVGYMAGSIDPSIADFQRNALYASAGSPTGSRVVTPVNFAGDPPGTTAGDAATESFLDASSIAAQGNETYDISTFVNPANPLPAGCDIKIVGSAPGASVMGLQIFSDVYDTTLSNFVQAIDHAVANGVQVLNESFGGNAFPDTAADATRVADDAAVGAGVTVVVSSGDAGVTNTIGSPASDPLLISVGASTTFRAYQQETFGGINATTPKASNGTWLNNNISSLSSGGFTQAGNTVDLVAPGDLNWALCSTSPQFPSCTSENGGAPSPIQVSGGTSESSPLTAGAAADVIQAYKATHGGTAPSPALVKQILVSTAVDVGAPAEQQGAGLLNVGAAIAAATAGAGLLASPTQLNIVQNPKQTTISGISLTNTGSSPVTVSLSTRALTTRVASTSGSFCLNPTSGTISCGPPTANTFHIWSGAVEVYQEETFNVPVTAGLSRLNFSADYQFTGQVSLLHVALIDPTGAYAGYTLPQGLGDFANVQVAHPVAGTWTAVFFTLKDSGSLTGTRGPIQWQAVTSQFGSGGKISPSSLTIPAGGTGSASFSAVSPSTSGDTAQSIVISTQGGPIGTIPVTIRTLVPMKGNGGDFTGVLTGGNGRGGAPGQMNTFAFDVPSGMRDIDVSAQFVDPNNGVIAFLVDPQGEAVASSSSVTLDRTFSNIIGTSAVNVYKDAPQTGRWLLLLDWLQVSGLELSERFVGAVRFNQVSYGTNLPQGRPLVAGTPYTFNVTIQNTGVSPQAFFLDPRGSTPGTFQLPSLVNSDQNMSLPLTGFSAPFYIVPTDTSAVSATMAGSVPVEFDTSPWPGDPDVASPVGTSVGVTVAPSGGEVMPGLWLLVPSEAGPYPAGAPPATASANFSVTSLPFDLNVTSSTGSLWTTYYGLNGFTPVYVMPGHSATMTMTITPSGAPGTTHMGVINIDDTFLININGPFNAPLSGDELVSIPYSYTIK